MIAMNAQYSRMQEFQTYMDQAKEVGENIVTHVPDTRSINTVLGEIESALYPIQTKPDQNDSETFETISTILDNRFSSGARRQKCPEMDESRQVSCMTEQLYFAALRLEALKHYEQSRTEQTGEAKPLGSACDTYHATHELIKADYRELVENGVEFNPEIIAEIDGLYSEDTQDFFKNGCPTLKDIMESVELS